MTQVLWFSRHSLDQDQLAGLRKIAGDEVEVRQLDRTISSADEIVDELGEATIVAVVLPVGLLSDLMGQLPAGVTVCVPRSRRVRESDGEYRYVHDYWEVVEECVYRSHRV